MAAQNSLSTIIAGLQIALTNPMKIDDVVFVDGEYGQIEEISLTYVVVRAWDHAGSFCRSPILLINRFKIWTRSSSELLGTVFLYVDYMVPRRDPRRIKTDRYGVELCGINGLFGVQVTDWKTDSVEVRILVSADASGKLFDLRCEVREKILAYLQQREPTVSSLELET